ncbi:MULTISPECIES: chromosome partitioning protein [Micromonospora]|uniref:Chromosome partitioning protein n=1 Tax=Micromonospora solifontis TaxID=2487138 RepID=A0ABX9WJ60_9ACTN|nr:MULTISPECIES: chromosome partitioning protein [Micromonospora]NES14450.1 chromosome partitioning protein [Micromonospora sp. PPF5-17B]NES36761.1 chromosome partitioning protein [Micromonospora solifontis]NES56381.1 chromosome partitioning protein [Micromonospora sp. PPF5-6]RNL99094.1 chromosome partitioning protein [Micromonospora solifontis]
MVHENTDRAHVPGQPQVPERDIEPLWPPEQLDPAPTTPPWAAPAQPGAPAWPVPAAPATPPTTPGPAPPVDPTTGIGPPVTATGPRPQGAAAGPAPAPTRAVDGGPAPRPAPAVDLDLPFTLDPPATGAAPPPRAAAASPAPPPPPDHGPAPAPGSAPVGGPAQAGAVSLADPAAQPAAAQPAAASPMPDHGDPVPATGATPNGSGPADAGPAHGRTASPWAQPPQRPNGGTSEPPADATANVGHPSANAPAAPGPEAAGPIPGPEAAGPTTPRPEAGTSAPPRLGPFPPAPGLPRPPSPYGNGQPAYPGESAYPPPQAAGTPPGWYPPVGPHAGAPQPGPSQPAAPQPAAPGPGQPAPPPPQPPAGYPEPGWTPEAGATPTAEDFARRRQARPADPVATMGVRAVVNRIGLVRLPPGRHEQELKRDIEMVRRNFGGLRQVTVVNPKGGAGKTVAILLLAMTFGQKRGGYVLAWDNNETQGTLGMRAQQDFHSRTVRDMLRDLAQFQGPHGRVGDLSQYVRSQGEGMFDVLASDESATGGEMLTAAAFAEIREVVSRFYKLIFVDTGNNVRAQNWQAAMDATDQLVVTMSARNDSAETAARMLDHLEQSGRQRLVRQAVTVVSMPPSRKEIDLPAIQAHFAARTRAVLLAPYERLIDTGEPIRYGQLSSATRDAWLKIAAAVAEGL